MTNALEKKQQKTHKVYKQGQNTVSKQELKLDYVS
uniref:Uncharacterized protein n=1 Tax=Anguilla anguilla TaxID=7936 RepID=A0A0E9TLK1_ANGAN